jgi:hypothetical protein
MSSFKFISLETISNIFISMCRYVAIHKGYRMLREKLRGWF